MFITTVTKNDDTTYRLHRDACKALNDSKRTVEAQLKADPQIVLDATPCSTCKPSKAVQVSVRAEAEKAAAGKAPKARKAVDTETAAEANLPQAEVVADAATGEQPETGEPTTTIGRGRSLAPKEGEKKCAGACGQVLPLTKFPTLPAKAGEVPQRGDVCRADRNAERAAKKAQAK